MKLASRISVLLLLTGFSVAWTPTQRLSRHQVQDDANANAPSTPASNRRDFMTALSNLGLGTAVTTTSMLEVPDLALAADTATNNNGLASRLASRDPSKLGNSIFNRPPAAQIYPDFMRGVTWDVTSRFGGYLFPSTKIPKSTLLNMATIPGFQKCSIAATSDIGKEGDVNFGMRILESGLDDRVYNLQQQIDAYLGYKAVSEVIYDPKANPNRISIDFVDYKTRNAERIELFCNGRESELVDRGDKNVFVCSEFIRQVTFSGGPDVGVARQVSGNYGHFWTWSQDKNSPGDTLTGNLLTAAYLDAQDPLFFDEPTKPVVVYSHILKATKRTKQS